MYNYVVKWEKRKMNNINNLDYSINTTVKNNKLQIEYKGKIFKENPSFVTKNTSKVKVMETQEGFVVELDIAKGNDLNFSINNINNEKILNKKENKYEEQLSQITDLTVIEKISIWKKIAHYIKKLAKGNLRETRKSEYIVRVTYVVTLFMFNYLLKI